MNSPTTLRKVALPLLVAFAVLYLFGMRSAFTTAALLVISVTVLFFALSSVLRGVDAAQDARDTGEQTFRHAGRDLRVYVDAQGEIWLRAADLKPILEYDQSNAVLARRYPTRFAQVHPAIDAWFMHHEALRDFVGPSGKVHVQRFLTWFTRDVLGMYRFERGVTKSRTLAVPSSAGSALTPSKPTGNIVLNWFRHQWRGELGLMSAVFGGAIVVGSASWLVHLLQEPVDITLHYRLSALIYVTQLAVVSGGMYWWGRGVLYSTQRWLASDHSLLAALMATVLGFGSVFYGLSTIVDTDKQYFLTDFFTIMLDADDKPKVDFDGATHRILLDGALGFGATNRVRQVLAGYPNSTGIELKSYGGRTSEGFALMALISKYELETFVKAECMSACVYAYMGGWQRHVASSAQFGLHRSGFTWQAAGKGRNGIDEAFASIMRSVGVDEAFINRGLEPSIHEIYMPSVKDVLEAKLATNLWDH